LSPRGVASYARWLPCTRRHDDADRPQSPVPCGLRRNRALAMSSILALWQVPQALRSSSCDHHDFTCNATPGDLFSVSLTPERRGELSRLADIKFCELAGFLGFAVLSSWWKHPLSSQNAGTDVAWLRREGMQVVEVYCNCPVAIAAERFVSRHRHPGHIDSLRTKHALLPQLSEAERVGPVFPQQALICDTERELSTSAVAELGRVNTILTSAAVRVSMQR
jgi:hypothetical protein